MKMFSGHPCIGIAVVMLVAVSVLFAGCTRPTSSTIPPLTGSPSATTVQGTPAPVATWVSSSLPYGVTISVPADWTKQDLYTSGLRDYGTTTVNIANFYSPIAILGDPASYTSLSVDVDPNPGSDFEKYFNDATIAVGKTYGEQMEAHSYTIPISGYKSYELIFQTPEVKGSYIFTSTENGMYIFSFRVPNKPQPVKAFQAANVDIYKSIRINPPTVVVTQHR